MTTIHLRSKFSLNTPLTYDEVWKRLDKASAAGIKFITIPTAPADAPDKVEGTLVGINHVVWITP